MKIRKGDKVMVVLGKDRGKSGTVERVINKKGKVAVGGINLVKRHVKKYGDIQGGILEIAKPIEQSNVMLVCPHCQKPTRVGFKFDGMKMRICKKCQKEIK